MPNIKLVVEYDGAAFHGWQVQPEQRTVQGELHRVLETVLREKIRVVHGSGRTDSGVHARGQVASFMVEKEPDLTTLIHSVSSILKGELSVLSAEIVPDSFDPRRNAKSKQYSYTILNRLTPAVLDKGRVWHVSADLNIELMQSEARQLIGVHDFSSFRAGDCDAGSPIREIMESEIIRDHDCVVYRVIGTGFLKQMVRIIVGTLVDIGKRKIDTDIKTLLEKKDRTQSGITAPAYGLSLDWVDYKG